MARPTKASNMTKAERKEAIAGLKQALKNAAAELDPFKKSAADADKAVMAVERAATKAITMAKKTKAAADAKLAKAQAAHDKGAEKINARIAELTATATGDAA